MPCSLLVASGTWRISKDGALAQRGDPTRTLVEGEGWMGQGHCFLCMVWGGGFNSENTGSFSRLLNGQAGATGETWKKSSEVEVFSVANFGI